MQQIDGPPDSLSAADVAREIGRAAVSMAPLVGGPIQVLFENIFCSPLEKRKREWLERVAVAINELQDRVSEITPERLAASETFVTVALTAFPIAVRNHQEEKLNALCNAVINSALSVDIDENKQLMFLRLVDYLTPWHLKILSLLQNPVQWMDDNGVKKPEWQYSGSLCRLVEHCFPELKDQEEFYTQMIRDLESAGLLIKGIRPQQNMSASGAMEPAITAHGRRFMVFICAPVS